MRTSETITKISTALLQAQKSLTFASKNSKNPHFKNTYADLSAVIDAVKPALNEAGIVFLQTPTPSDNGYLFLTTRLIHESGEWIEDTATCPLPKQDPQGYGSALTYARRYSLMAACGIAPEDDDGNSASRRTEIKSTVNESQIADLMAAMDDCTTLEDLQKTYKSAYAACQGDPN